jgi:hypothetical protein
MISLVIFEKTHYNVLPYEFEAGTLEKVRMTINVRGRTGFP